MSAKRNLTVSLIVLFSFLMVAGLVHAQNYSVYPPPTVTLSVLTNGYSIIYDNTTNFLCVDGSYTCNSSAISVVYLLNPDTGAQVTSSVSANYDDIAFLSCPCILDGYIYVATAGNPCDPNSQNPQLLIINETTLIPSGFASAPSGGVNFIDGNGNYYTTPYYWNLDAAQVYPDGDVNQNVGFFLNESLTAPMSVTANNITYSVSSSGTTTACDTNGNVIWTNAVISPPNQPYKVAVEIPTPLPTSTPMPTATPIPVPTPTVTPEPTATPMISSSPLIANDLAALNPLNTTSSDSHTIVVTLIVAIAIAATIPAVVKKRTEQK